MAINYYQLVTLVEVSPKVLNVSGLAINAIFFLFLVITFGQPSLFCLKQLFVCIKWIHTNLKQTLQSEIRILKEKVQIGILGQQNPEQQKRIQLK